jgi:hypothetical protein
MIISSGKEMSRRMRERIIVKVFPLIFILALLVSGCASLSLANELPTLSPIELTPTVPSDGTATFTPFSAPTFTAIPSSTIPAPTLTLTTTPTADPADGVYTFEQSERLHQASLKYLAATDGEAVRVARDLKFVQGADVSNMCGPLAAAILRDAGFMPADLDIHNFWLLNPRQKQHRIMLEQIFPASQYTDFKTDQPTYKFDFRRYPLRVGDFVYVYAGKDGSFEHMLTITRMDELGRAYTVTNLHTDSYNFAIREVALYDPTLPGIGQFYDWTNKKNYQLGITGLGGFEVWRRIVPLP